MRLRNRTVKAEFWADLKLRGMDRAYKLVYIGLWQACDDAGYGVWEPSELAALLFPYDPPEDRELLLIGAFTELRERGLVKPERCGHFVIPSLPRHVYSSDRNRTSATKRDHEAGRCPKPPRNAAARRGDPRAAATGRVGSDRVGMGRENARAHEGNQASDREALEALINNPESNEAAVRAARKALERLGS